MSFTTNHAHRKRLGAAAALTLAVAFAAGPVSFEARAQDRLAYGAVVKGDPSGDDLAWGAGLSADELVSAVIARNASLEDARAAAEAAAHRVAPAGALDDPMVTYASAPGTIGVSDFDYGQRLEISQSLPWPGKLDARQNAAQREAEAAGHAASARRLDVVAAAKSALAEWWFVHQAIALNEENRVVLEDLRAIAESHFAAGFGLRQDVLQAETEIALLADQLLSLDAQKAGVQARINALVNRRPESPLPPPLGVDLTAPPNLATLIAAAEQGHPQLQRLERLADARAADSELARLEFYPDVRVTGGYNSLWQADEQRTTIGLSVNIPLNQGRRRAELSAARADERSARWRLTDERSRLLADIAATFAAAERSAQSVALYEEQLAPLADQTLEAAISEYQSRASDFFNVIDAERNKLRIEISLARARADHARRLAELESLVGAPLEDPNGDLQ